MRNVRTFFAAALLQAALSAASFGATITQWTFETSLPLATDSTTIGGLQAEVGVGSAGGVHARLQTDWSNPVGNGSAESFSSNEWSVGDYYEFMSATTGFTDIMVSFAHISSSTGPANFRLDYSTDGAMFTTAGPYLVLNNNLAANSWSSGTAQTSSVYSFDLSAVDALDDAASVTFRLVSQSTISAGGGTVATSGTSRVDNFTISGTEIPEPGALVLLLTGLAHVARRRR